MKRGNILFTRIGELNRLATLMHNASGKNEAQTERELDGILEEVAKIDDADNTGLGGSLRQWALTHAQFPTAAQTLSYLSDIVSLAIEGEHSRLAEEREKKAQQRELGRLITPGRLEADLRFAAQHAKVERGNNHGKDVHRVQLAKKRARCLQHMVPQGPSGGGGGKKRGNG